jgi:hypothetical protein
MYDAVRARRCSAYKKLLRPGDLSSHIITIFIIIPASLKHMGLLACFALASGMNQNPVI